MLIAMAAAAVVSGGGGGAAIAAAEVLFTDIYSIQDPDPNLMFHFIQVTPSNPP